MKKRKDTPEGSTFELRQNNKELMRRNIKDYFLNFSRYARPWLLELGKKFKESEDYPMHPFVLADLYEDPQDIETALFASLLIKEKDGQDITPQVISLKEVITDSPYRWYATRCFVNLPDGRIPGTEISYSHVSQLFQRLWDIEGGCYFDYDSGETITRRVFMSTDLETEIRKDVESINETAFESLLFRLEGVHGIQYPYWKLNFLLMRLYRRNGFGIGLWGRGNERLLCPIKNDVERFLSIFFPDYRRYGSCEDAISLMGFEDTTDFLYAYYGYKRLCEEKPSECSTFATKYIRWYKNGSNIDRSTRLRNLLPEFG